MAVGRYYTRGEIELPGGHRAAYRFQHGHADSRRITRRGGIRQSDITSPAVDATVGVRVSATHGRGCSAARLLAGPARPRKTSPTTSTYLFNARYLERRPSLFALRRRLSPHSPTPRCAIATGRSSPCRSSLRFAVGYEVGAKGTWPTAAGLRRRGVSHQWEAAGVTQLHGRERRGNAIAKWTANGIEATHAAAIECVNLVGAKRMHAARTTMTIALSRFSGEQLPGIQSGRYHSPPLHFMLGSSTRSSAAVSPTG